jgi:hypothetical protein
MLITCVLVKANMEADEADRLPDEELLGQVSYVTHLRLSFPKFPLTAPPRTLIFAATDSTSTVLSRLMHILSQHQDVQDKLRAEIREAHEEYGPRLPYDVIIALPFLDAVCKETLRLYVYAHLHPLVSLTGQHLLITAATTRHPPVSTLLRE